MSSPLRLVALLLAAAVLAGPAGAQERSQSFESRLSGLVPRAVTSFGAARLGPWLYVLGGAQGRPHRYDRNSQSPRFERLDLRSGLWEALPETERAQGLALVALDGELYRIGGMRSTNAPGTRQHLESLTRVETFDPERFTWTACPPLPRGRSSHDAVAVDGRIVVAGGWRLDGAARDARWDDEVLAWTPADPDAGWRVLAQAPTARRALALAALDGALWLLGGMDDRGRTLRSVDVLDLASGAWRRGPDLPVDGFGVAATVSGGALLLSGRDGALWRLAEDGGRWEAAGRLAFARYFHRLVPDGRGGAHVVGGAGRGGRVRHLEHLRPGAGSGPLIQTLEVPYSGRSRNRQGMVLAHDSLLLFGGNRSPGQHDFGPEDFVCECWELDLASLRLRRGPDLPAARQSIMAVATGDAARPEVWAVGGFGNDGSGARTAGSVLSRDPRSGVWGRAAPDLPAPRSQGGLVVFDAALWLFGGLDYDPRRAPGRRFDHVLPVLRRSLADAASPWIETGLALPRPRRAFGAARLGDRYVLVGGMGPGFRAVTVCDVLDLVRGAWTTIPAPRTPRIGPSLVTLGGRLYLAGGAARDATGSLVPARSLEVFDPRTRSWSTLVEELPLPAKHLRMFVHQERLLLVSTHGDASSIRLVLVDPNLPAPEAPAPTGAGSGR